MRKNNGRKNNILQDVPPIVWMLLAMLILFSITADNFLSVHSFMNILRQSVPLLILAIGQTMIVLTGGTDLSLGAQVSFTTVMWILMAQAGINIYVAAVLALELETDCWYRRERYLHLSPPMACRILYIALP